MFLDIGYGDQGIFHFAPIPLYYKLIPQQDILGFNDRLKQISKKVLSEKDLEVPDDRREKDIIKLYPDLDFFEEKIPPAVGKWHGIKTNDLLSNVSHHEVSWLKNHIIKEYVKCLSIKNDSSIDDKSPLIVENWIQFYKKGDSKMLHNHERYFPDNYTNLWSGAYYLDDGNPLDHVKYSGLFSFKIRETNYYIKPKPGLLLMWESDLLHQVHEFYGKNERVVLNFNLALE